MVVGAFLLFFVRETMGKRQNPYNQDSKRNHQLNCAFYSHILTSPLSKLEVSRTPLQKADLSLIFTLKELVEKYKSLSPFFHL